MRRSLIYCAFAILLGLTAVLGPTWVFLGHSNKQATFTESLTAFASGRNLKVPILDTLDSNQVKNVSYQEAALLAGSLILALTVHLVSKKRIPI